jgi:uncharacterized protein YbjT (DUF2867 family)
MKRTRLSARRFDGGGATNAPRPGARYTRVDRLRRDAVPVRVLSRHGGDLDAEIFLGRIADRDAVQRAASDAAGVVVIVESSEEPGPNGPQAVHFHGVENVIAAAVPTARIVLVTRIYLTAPEAFERVREVIVDRRRGEEALRASSRPYVIARPSWLTNQPGGQRAIRLEQGDAGEGEIAHADGLGRRVCRTHGGLSRHSLWPCRKGPSRTTALSSPDTAGCKRASLRHIILVICPPLP